MCTTCIGTLNIYFLCRPIRSITTYEILLDIKLRVGLRPGPFVCLLALPCHHVYMNY